MKRRRTGQPKIKNKNYRLFPHTADIGLLVQGKNLKSLFYHAAQGMFSLLLDLSKIKVNKSIKITLRAENQEELLVRWLNELLYRFNVKKFIPKKISFPLLSANRLSAEVQGYKYRVLDQPVKLEIKAATYHQLKVRPKGMGWQAEVIFDV